jgi:hypothetical protein
MIPSIGTWFYSNVFQEIQLTMPQSVLNNETAIPDVMNNVIKLVGDNSPRFKVISLIWLICNLTGYLANKSGAFTFI